MPPQSSLKDLTIPHCAQAGFPNPEHGIEGPTWGHVGGPAG